MGSFYATAGGGTSVSEVLRGSVADLVNGTGNDFGGHFGTGGLVEFGAGLYLPWNFRADATASYRTGFTLSSTAVDPFNGVNDSAQGASSTNWTVLGNLYYDIQTGTDFTPYVGFGVGWAQNKLGDVVYRSGGLQTGTESGTTRTNLAWRAAAGLSYAVTSSLLLDLGYRHLDAGEFRSSGVVTDPYGGIITGSPARLKLVADEYELLVRFKF